MDKFPSSIFVEYIDIQFSLPAESRHREVAAPEKCEDRIEAVVAMREIKFRVQRVSQVKLNGQFPAS